MMSLQRITGYFLLCLLALPAQHVLAEDVQSHASEDLCVVRGSEEKRSKMYEESADAEEIMELERRACWMIAERELRRLGDEIIDENGLLFLDGGPILYGRAQQLEMFAEFLSLKGVYFTYEPVEAHVSASKDMAWAFGLYELQLPDAEMEVGKYVSVWQKRDGQWKNVAEMRNPF